MEDTQGKTTVSPEVLMTIARLSALSVPGVSKLAPISGGVNRLFKRGAGDGVRIETEENAVYVDLHRRPPTGCEHPRGQPQRPAECGARHAGNGRHGRGLRQHPHRRH